MCLSHQYLLACRPSPEDYWRQKQVKPLHKQGKPLRCVGFLCQQTLLLECYPRADAYQLEALRQEVYVRRVLLIIWCSWVHREMWKLSTCDLTSAPCHAKRNTLIKLVTLDA